MAAKILTLSERIYRSHDTTDPYSRAVLTSGHDGGHWLYKQWSEKQMKSAVDAVIMSHLSVRYAAMQYNVPKLTFVDRVSE